MVAVSTPGCGPGREGSIPSSLPFCKCQVFFARREVSHIKEILPSVI